MNVYEQVTANILAQLEAGVIPWRKSWRTSSTGPTIPTNAHSGKPYRGCNALTLMWTPFSSNLWVTYKQAQELGYQVRKGERSTSVVFWKFVDRAAKGAQAVTPADGADAKGFAFAKFYNVFNLDQCDGVPVALPFDSTFDPIAEAQTLADAFYARPGAPTLAHGGDRAFYAPGRDHVQMPPQAAFETGDAYYATLFHESVHATGAPARLDRSDLDARKRGDDNYAREELIAEFGASFLCAETGVLSSRRLEDSAAYISHWLTVLRNDKTLAVAAAQRAQKAADYVMGREFAQAAPISEDAAVAA
jgi:antirestriction protein ArdC